MRCASYGIAASVMLLVAASPVAAASYKFTSDEAGYSITFPEQPQQEVTEENNAHTVLNAVNHDEGYYAVVHVDHAYEVSADDELDGNITKFTQQIGAPAQLRRRKKFAKAPGDQLPAEDFIFESVALVGKGFVVVDGRRTYMVVAFSNKPHNRKAAVDRFVASFKFKTAAKAKDIKPSPDAKAKPKAIPEAKQ